MAKRSGLSISIKLILVSTLLVLSTAMGLGIMGIGHLGDAYDAMTESRIAHHLAALESRGSVTDQPADAVAVASSLETVDRIAEQGRMAREAAQDRAMLRILAVSVVCLVLCVTIIGFYGMRICRRLVVLAWEADRIAHSDPEAPTDSSSKDEIGMLGDSFNRMVERVRTLVAETRADAVLEKELQVARTVQENLVPSNVPMDWGCFSLAGDFQPASKCSGNWWTYHGLADGKVLLIIGDAAGHGSPSAMITAAAKAACDVARAVSGDELDVSTLLSLMNRAIYESAKQRLAMTCFAAIICPETRVITYANAGHNFPYLYRVGEDGRGEFGSLMMRGNRLGDLEETHYESKTTQLRPGDTLIWYTDGVVEGKNAKGEEYGEKRFRTSIRQAVHLSAGDLRNTVVSDAMNFFGKARRKDDVTIVVGRVS